MRRGLIVLAAVTLMGAAALGACHMGAIAAGGLLYPRRVQALPARPSNCDERIFSGEGVALHGWDCRAEGARRGTLIYLHGTADNRGSSLGVIRRFTPKGLAVVAYDSRRHGLSEGEVCTYGYFEKQDLHRVISAMPPGPIVLFGTSLGAAVALQEAAGDSRVATVIAVEVFSDLRTIARDRAPGILSESTIRKAFQVAESKGRFVIDEVSPVRSARSVRVPVLLIHGAEDRDTPPAHSVRVLSALAGPKRLILVERAGHNRSLSEPGIWKQIDDWIERVLPLRSDVR